MSIVQTFQAIAVSGGWRFGHQHAKEVSWVCRRIGYPQFQSLLELLFVGLSSDKPIYHLSNGIEAPDARLDVLPEQDLLQSACHVMRWQCKHWDLTSCNWDFCNLGIYLELRSTRHLKSDCRRSFYYTRRIATRGFKRFMRFPLFALRFIFKILQPGIAAQRVPVSPPWMVAP